MYISQSHRNLFATTVNAKSCKINRVCRPVIPGNICLSSGPFYKIHYLLDFLGKKDKIRGGHGRVRTRIPWRGWKGDALVILWLVGQAGGTWMRLPRDKMGYQMRNSAWKCKGTLTNRFLLPSNGGSSFYILMALFRVLFSYTHHIHLVIFLTE